MSPFEYVKNKVLVKVKPSSYNGVGVFALKDIPSNTPMFEPWEGETGTYELTEQEVNSLPLEIKEHIKDIFLFHPDFPNNTNVTIDLFKNCHWIFTTPYYFVNSGFIDGYNMDKDTLTTIRDIKKGEEILSNYGRYEKSKVLI